MNYKTEYRIANLKSSLGKENNLEYYQDYVYNDENLAMVLENYSKIVNKNKEAQFKYLCESMPKLDELQSIVEDILDFYEKRFKMYTPEKECKITFRFFVHVKFMYEDGDARGDEIRIGCNNFANFSMNSTNFAKFLDNIRYEKSEYFKNQLRTTLAHEIYHVLHFRHCQQIGKQHGTNIYEEILDELFAKYFEYEYFNSYLEKTDNIKRNDIYNWYESVKYFGVGRKYLFPEDYSELEIKEDNEKLNSFMSNNIARIYTETNHNTVSTAEYDAGCFLSFYERKYKESNSGADLQLYSQMYQDYLSGNSKEALLRLIKIKNKEYTNY